MRRNSTIKIATPRQPEAEGPDVVYNGSDFDAFSNGIYICSRSNSQDAWIEARRVYFEAVEAARYETADMEAEIAETAELEAYAAEWDAAAACQRTAAELDIISSETETAYNALEGNDKAFADIITAMLNDVEPPYRAMAEAGLTLLAAACSGVGPHLADDSTDKDEEEETGARIYHAAYKQGYHAGRESGIEELMHEIRGFLSDPAKVAA